MAADEWDEIVPGLWQGGDARSPVGAFDHVVSLCALGDGLTPGPADQTAWFIDDGPLPDPEERIWEVARDVSERLDRGERVLVRCQMGMNRSGLIVGATLLLRGFDAEEAIERIRRRRHRMALSNPNFEAWLRAQEGRGIGATGSRSTPGA